MASPSMSPEWNNLVKEDPSVAIVPKSVEEYRTLKQQRGLDGLKFLEQPAFALLKDAVVVTNTTATLPEAPGHEFRIRIYRPARETVGSGLPMMLYFHGGFWVAGDANAEDLGCRAIIARGNDIVIVSFEYRLVSDSTSWRTTFSDAEYAVKWLWENAAQYGGDLSKGFLVGGAEGGCHLAAISAIRTRNRHPEIKLTGQCLIVPTTIAYPDPKIPPHWQNRLQSHVDAADAPVLNQALFEKVIAALNMSDEEKRDGENFPCWADLKGLPPAYLPMDECDPTRDQGFLYAELLREAGVQTRVDYYEGLPNMFVNFPALPATPFAGGQLTAGIAWLLEKKNFPERGA